MKILSLKILKLLILPMLFFTPVCANLQKAAQAQEDAGPVWGEVTEESFCFNIINEAPYGIHGSISTNYYTTPDGIKATHRANFYLKEEEQTQFCTTGPFYEGRKVDMVLRTLIPIFSCRTGVEGDIIIKGRKKPEGGTETWADCL